MIAKVANEKKGKEGCKMSILSSVKIVEKIKYECLKHKLKITVLMLVSSNIITTCFTIL